ncbi:MAG: hypothetical protein ACT4OO_14435 [Nitrospiraceae bacterium]
MSGWPVATAGSLLVMLTACSEGVQLVQTNETGGIVTYSFKQEKGHLFSPFRNEAFQVMKKHCGGSYSIVREGEAKGYSSASSGLFEGSEEEAKGRRWGIQFRCKNS